MIDKKHFQFILFWQQMFEENILYNVVVFQHDIIVITYSLCMKYDIRNKRQSGDTYIFKKNFYFSIQILAMIMTNDIVIGGEQRLLVLITIDRIIIVKY